MSLYRPKTEAELIAEGKLPPKKLEPKTQPQLEKALKTLMAMPPNVSVSKEEATKRKTGRPSSGKIVTTLRLDPEIITALKRPGPGWQARANDLLRKALSL